MAVLDLYAGSGALGIEALSRGARVAVLVDRDRLAVDACRRNLASTHLRERARVQCSTVTSFLSAGPPGEAPFGFVFVDPPYETDPAEIVRVLSVLSDPGWTAPGASVVVERGAGAPLDATGRVVVRVGAGVRRYARHGLDRWYPGPVGRHRDMTTRHAIRPDMRRVAWPPLCAPGPSIR